MSHSQPTFEGLPRELRDSIYGYVFGPTQVIKPKASIASKGVAKYDCNYLPPPEPESLVHSSILATSKACYGEAIMVLYETTIVRGTVSDFEKLLQSPDFVRYVRRVEIADCIQGYKHKSFHSVLQRLRALRQEKLESIVILSDCLGYLHNSRNENFMPVSKFCEKAELSQPVCYDIGKYRLCDEL